jgi:hypothetical protein
MEQNKQKEKASCSLFYFICYLFILL